MYYKSIKLFSILYNKLKFNNFFFQICICITLQTYNAILVTGLVKKVEVSFEIN